MSDFETRRPAIIKSIPAALRMSCDAEMSLIGTAAMAQSTASYDPAAFDDALARVLPDYFADENYRQAWAIMAALRKACKSVVPETVATLLAPQIGYTLSETVELLAEAIEVGAPGSYRMTEYADAVVRSWQTRELTYSLRDLDIHLGDSRVGVDEALETLTTRMDAVMSVARANDWIDRGRLGAVLSERQATPADEMADFMPTGLDTLDKALGGGLHPGRLIVVGARASVGKTTFCGQIGLRAAKSCRSVAMLSYEMSEAEMLARFISQANWHLDDEAEMDQLANLPLRVWQTTDWGIERIETEAKRLAGRHGLDMLIVDYLGLIPRAHQRQQDIEHLTDCTMRLKQLATRLGCCVVLAAQFNRAKDGREDPRPHMSDFRGCGSIENDADQLIGLHRAVAANDAATTSEARLYLMKNRQGPTTEMAMTFMGTSYRFGEAVAYHEESGFRHGF